MGRKFALGSFLLVSRVGKSNACPFLSQQWDACFLSTSLALTFKHLAIDSGGNSGSCCETCLLSADFNAGMSILTVDVSQHSFSTQSS